LRACWSTPIFGLHREVLGTFAMYYRHPALPEAEHQRLIEMATHIASLAICSDCTRARLRKSEANLKEAQSLAKIGYWNRDIRADRLTWSDEMWRIFGLEPQNLTPTIANSRAVPWRPRWNAIAPTMWNTGSSAPTTR
jgi:GAF domain-containing protein